MEKVNFEAGEKAVLELTEDEFYAIQTAIEHGIDWMLEDDEYTHGDAGDPPEDRCYYETIRDSKAVLGRLEALDPEHEPPPTEEERAAVAEVRRRIEERTGVGLLGWREKSCWQRFWNQYDRVLGLR